MKYGTSSFVNSESDIERALIHHLQTENDIEGALVHHSQTESDIEGALIHHLQTSSMWSNIVTKIIDQ